MRQMPYHWVPLPDTSSFLYESAWTFLHPVWYRVFNFLPQIQPEGKRRSERALTVALWDASKPWLVMNKLCLHTQQLNPAQTGFVYKRMERGQILKFNCIIPGYKRLFLCKYRIHWKPPPCSTPFSHLSTQPMFLMFPLTLFMPIWPHYQCIQICGSQRREKRYIPFDTLIVSSTVHVNHIVSISSVNGHIGWLYNLATEKSCCKGRQWSL